LKAGVVRISKALALVTKAKRPGLAATKTENRVRDLPIHSAALKVLTAWHAKGFAEFAGRAPRDEDPVFPAPRCTGELVHWRPKMSPMLRKDLRSSGQSDHFEGHPLTAHGLRRSFASWLAEADVSLLNRQRLMGHAAANVTDGAYTSTSLDTLRVAVESIKLVLSVGEVIALRVKIASTL
jgi:integrase